MTNEAVHFTTYGFDEADRVQIRGVYYRVKPRPDGLGYIFTDVDQRLKPYKPFHLEISKLIAKRHLFVDRMWFAEDDAVRNAQSIDLTSLPAYAVSRFMMVTKFLEGWEEGKWSKTEVGAQEFYDAWDELQGKQRGGTVKNDWDPLTRVTPRQFLKHVEKFVFTGQDPKSFILNHRGKKDQPSPFDPIREIAEEYIDLIPNAKRPRASRFFKKFADDPRISPLPEDKKPSLRTFQRWAADRLPDVHIALAHKGAHDAKDEFQMTGAGQRRFKPLERIEFDETKLDVMKLLKGTRLDGLIDEQTKKKIKAMRFWASIAIDVGTRSILALRLLDTNPGGRSGVETLAMAVVPKDGIAVRRERVFLANGRSARIDRNGLWCRLQPEKFPDSDQKHRRGASRPPGEERPISWNGRALFPNPERPIYGPLFGSNLREPDRPRSLRVRSQCLDEFRRICEMSRSLDRGRVPQHAARRPE